MTPSMKSNQLTNCDYCLECWQVKCCNENNIEYTIILQSQKLSGYVKPIVDTVLPLSQASQAYEGAKGVHKHGKVVLHVI